MRQLFIPLFVIAIVAASALALTSRGPAEADTVGIETGSNWFCSSSFQTTPCVTIVTAGDTVTWTIVQGFHTVTECEAGHTNCGNGFESGILQNGESFSQTFNSAGSISYYCSIHPDMTGVINVQEATPTPAPTSAPSDGATAAPTIAQSPGTVPQTGGPPQASGGMSAMMLMLAAGAVLLIAGGSATLVARRLE